MKATELRIGNFIQDKKWKTAWKINCFLGLSTVEVDTAAVDFPTDSCHEPSLHTLEPIPLTEEWLERFGFNNNYPVSSREYLIDSNDEVVLINHYEKGFLITLTWWDAGMYVKYVHQLQNLYFALTGQELTLTK
jgi:hypothetical protein